MKENGLITADRIAARVAELGKELSEFYKGKKLNIVILLNGAFIFAADLVRALDPDLDVTIDSIGVSSYRGTKSTGELKIRSELKNIPEDTHILLVDDILDTGLTLEKTVRYFESRNASSVRTCVVLDKEYEDSSKKKYKADWVGFRVPDVFVVGYGLDYNEKGRNLPYIGYMSND